MTGIKYTYTPIYASIPARRGSGMPRSVQPRRTKSATAPLRRSCWPNPAAVHRFEIFYRRGQSLPTHRGVDRQVTMNRIIRARLACRRLPSWRQRGSPRFTAGAGASTLRDVSLPGRPASLARTTVTGFLDGAAIASATPDGPTGHLLATSTANRGRLAPPKSVVA
jgi:hypothetical protein